MPSYVYLHSAEGACVDIRDWNLLIALDSKKCMGKAGDMLFLSQPAVAYRLDRMEKEFSTQLFLRNKQGIQFTEAGLRLLSYAEKMISQYNAMHHNMQQFTDQTSHTVSIGCGASFFRRLYAAAASGL